MSKKRDVRPPHFTIEGMDYCLGTGTYSFKSTFWKYEIYERDKCEGVIIKNIGSHYENIGFYDDYNSLNELVSIMNEYIETRRKEYENRGGKNGR